MLERIKEGQGKSNTHLFTTQINFQKLTHTFIETVEMTLYLKNKASYRKV